MKNNVHKKINPKSKIKSDLKEFKAKFDFTIQPKDIQIDKDEKHEDVITIEKLTSTNLNTLSEYKALYPHWEKSKILNKINKTLNNQDTRFVVKKNGSIIGQIRVKIGTEIHSHRAELTSLIILPQERGKGIGKKLMSYTIKNMPKNIKLILLSVDEKNKPAIKIYKKLGFEKYGLLKNGSIVNGKYTTNLLMKKTI